ncbi:phosphoribosylanthranilate isomerase [Oceanomicrobium pacificus]|uniref:phosphoribosylanthranilate isomerase n=1 Tax=Oceanomicrobium pacificus TaxID=2692916 RepID=UPI0019681240|nr:phosphoribosylanthranilate isomerase [Oceanomicrobium pacificus]
MTRVKICCIGSLGEAQAAARAGADAIGLVAAMPSGPGPIPEPLIADIIAATPPTVMTVLLSAETNSASLLDQVKRMQPKAIQLVDPAAAAAVPDLRAAAPTLRIIEVLHVTGPESLVDAERSQADMLLLDSGAPDAAVPELGGTGRVHDWSVSAEIVRRADRPVWLAGGLTPDNVTDALRTVRPYGVDICSGLRPAGALDGQKLASFMQAVRGRR